MIGNVLPRAWGRAQIETAAQPHDAAGESLAAYGRETGRTGLLAPETCRILIPESGDRADCKIILGIPLIFLIFRR